MRKRAKIAGKKMKCLAHRFGMNGMDGEEERGRGAKVKRQPELPKGHVAKERGHENVEQDVEHVEREGGSAANKVIEPGTKRGGEERH